MLVTAYIVSRKTGLPIEFISVSTQDRTRSTVTDQNGEFTIDVPTGEGVQIEGLGYQGVAMLVNEGDIIQLDESDNILPDFVVEGVREVSAKVRKNYLPLIITVIVAGIVIFLIVKYYRK